ncbi:hypothetical protein PANT111_40186 [Pantoea brenneri]|uniref:Uncharacterized protein n=2 Tax=Enterobacterales TaxID=91347 RepID=A0A7D5FVL2_9ENTR|nr:hypothetical protein [Leclercia adecarboxylata]VXC41142.1 hypothetical protein PANT111_40186 [Pantoea brenneri]
MSLNIKAANYSIVGDNVLHSISKVLSVPMNNSLIGAYLSRTSIWTTYLSDPRKGFMMSAVPHPAAGWADALLTSAKK